MNTIDEPIVRIDLEPLGGIAGDMFAAAMFGAFPDLFEDFENDIAQLNVAGLSASLEDRLSNGLQAKYFSVTQKTTAKPPRTLATVKAFLESKSLEPSVCNHATGIFRLLAHAEAQVHGKTMDTIHFHEVSDWDSMVDIVAAAGIIARVKCAHWRIGHLPLGAGSVNTAHGDIPVPAPATLALLTGFQWHDDGVAGERVTPTGAAIVAYLEATPAGMASAQLKLCAVGSGCGTRVLEGRANLLRVMAFTRACQIDESGDVLLTDEVVRIGFEVDDMTAEEVAWSTDRLRACEGVLDVSCVMMQGKKGRVATGIRILVQPETVEPIIQQCFKLTSTLGVRYGSVTRKVLPRRKTETQGHELKMVERPGNIRSAKIGSDDLSESDTLELRRHTAITLQSLAVNEALTDGSEA